MAYDEDDEDRPTPPRTSAEGVRIIGAQEAAQREAELQSGRLPDDALRYGDVPPPPSGPRPAVRFPLPEDAEPPATPPPAAGGAELPHWTEEPTGEVPRVLANDDEDDDFEAWAALRRQPRWREGSDWEEADFADDELAAAGEERLGALDDRPRAPEFAFDTEEEEDFDDLEPAAARRAGSPARSGQASSAPRRVSSRPSAAEPYDYGERRGGDRDMAVAVGVGVGLGIVALLCYWAGPGWFAALATVVVVVAAVEVFDNFRRAGLRPATLLGVAGTFALMVGAYNKGERAIPLVLALGVVFSTLWYLFGVVRARPTANLGVTLLGLLWVGFLGSFASLMLRHPGDDGKNFLLGAVLAVVANDVGARFAGRSFGNTPLMPEISPNKTVEGFFGGFLISLVMCLAVVGQLDPWSFGSAFWLAVVVSLAGPGGDLAESMIKRDLGVKDMGTILPGHGGVLDRFDALLYALPAVYYLVEVLDLTGA
ncbi:MAG TPA: phosphatidate cytidylyltransferase [Acidimicrobiales bacterium]|nr:phosphatidate cytidylyltransferase [Acidimicrobiales bacterium]